MVENKKKLQDYEIIKKIGEGSYGDVYSAKDIKTNEIVAIKRIDKLHVVKYNKSEAVYRERDILKQL